MVVHAARLALVEIGVWSIVRRRVGDGEKPLPPPVPSTRQPGGALRLSLEWLSLQCRCPCLCRQGARVGPLAPVAMTARFCAAPVRFAAPGDGPTLRPSPESRTQPLDSPARRAEHGRARDCNSASSVTTSVRFACPSLTISTTAFVPRCLRAHCKSMATRSVPAAGWSVVSEPGVPCQRRRLSLSRAGIAGEAEPSICCWATARSDGTLLIRAIDHNNGRVCEGPDVGLVASLF